MNFQFTLELISHDIFFHLQNYGAIKYLIFKCGIGCRKATQLVKA